MSELKPCPFCGVNPVLSQDFFGRYDVRCLNTACEIMPSTRVYDKAEDAAVSWNRRAEVPKRIDGKPTGMSAEQFDACYEDDSDER